MALGRVKPSNIVVEGKKDTVSKQLQRTKTKTKIYTNNTRRFDNKPYKHKNSKR